MGRISVFTDLILLLSYTLLCNSEPVNLGEPYQKAIFRHPMPVPGPAQNVQASFQNLIESRRPASWRAAQGSPPQEFIQIPMQVQSQRTNYAPVPLAPNRPLQSQLNFGLSKPEAPSQTQQGFQKPMPGPVLQPVVRDEVVIQSGFEVKMPANTVEVYCGEDSVKVQAQQDFLGNHQFIDPSDLTLGGCPFVGFDDHARIVVFESTLQGCGSTLTMTEDSLVYSFILMYSPSPVPDTPIVKSNEANVDIHCIYPRKHNVSSNALRPTWIPHAEMKAGEDRLQFSLKLMTDDWRNERPSSTYFLGNSINVEASVVRANHVPLQVFVESCAATLGPSGNAATVYTFIENSGCMIDAKLTGSSSTFMPRIQDNKLQFQIEAFRFQQDPSRSIYITCHLKATSTSSATDSMHKACSYVTRTNSWVAVNGDDHLCDCCESSCAIRKGRSVNSEGDFSLEDEATVGPIFIEETRPDEKHLLPIRESFRPSLKDPEFSIELLLVTGLVVVVGVLSAVILGTLFYQKHLKRLTVICE
nr:zona pellucida sperm-binding protein 3-like isoform X1 [Misgurnus anguillicaudatus]